MKQKMKYILFSLIPLLLLLLVSELLLRLVLGFPSGMCNIIIRGEYGLYPSHREFINYVGVAPYRIKTNSLGMRSPEINRQKEKNTIRIACLGDSYTDGFYVDNEQTYPALLQEILNAKQAELSIEVINGARGGGTIAGIKSSSFFTECTGQLATLVNVVAPLSPDVVVLLFYANDIYELSENPGVVTQAKELIVSYRGVIAEYNKPFAEQMSDWIFTRTAIGETLIRFKRPFLYENFQRNKDIGLDEHRYDHLTGGANFLDNLENYWQRYSSRDGMVLTDKKLNSPKTRQLLTTYLDCLKLANEFCLENQIQLVFAYLPAYLQIYLQDERLPLTIRDILKTSCDNEAIPFCDLTETFQEAGQAEVLHFAPLDYHHNPAGNLLLAKGISQYLKDAKLIKVE